MQYAVERTFARDPSRLGPSYYRQLLAPPKPAYRSPYQDRSKNIMGPKRADTEPDHDRVPPGAPVRRLQPRDRDPVEEAGAAEQGTSPRFQLHPVSTCPYKFQSYQLNHRSRWCQHLLEPFHRPEHQAAAQ